MEDDLKQSVPENLTKIIRPAKAITPSITNTLKSDKTSKSDNMKLERQKDTMKRIKKVIISSSRRVIRSHSEKTKKATERRSQMVNTTSGENEMVHEGQNIEK